MKTILMGCGALAIGVVVLGIVIVVIAAVAVSNDPKSKALLTGDAEDVTVAVTGSAGAFSGSLGSINSRSVDGTTPQSFTIDGKDSSGIFTAVLQKKAVDGTLVVELKGCPDGEPHIGSTSAAYGLVTVSC